MPKEPEIKIGFSMGDPNGIGPEVLIRALHYLHPFKEWVPLIFGDLEILNEINKAVGASFSYKPIPNNHDKLFKDHYDPLCIPVIVLPVRKNRNWELGLCSSWGGESAFKFFHNAILWANKKIIDAVGW